jgi:serine/threonine protein kinase
MTTLSSIDEFLDALRKSGLLDPELLDAWLGGPGPRGTARESAQALAEALVHEGLLTLFQTQYLLRGQHKGLVLAGKYKVLDLLAVGDGRVFRGEDTTLRRAVAIKVLPPARAATPGVIERFTRQVRAVASVQAPNLLHVFDADSAGKQHFVVSEYVDGCTANSIVQRTGPMTFGRACNYVLQACTGLQHAHKAGWFHRDIKPGNLLIDRRGVVKVLDLGLARFFGEIRNDLPAEEESADPRSDLFGLGATLFYLLMGRHPIQEGIDRVELTAPDTEPQLDLTGLRTKVPLGLAAVVARMLTPSPAAQYHSAAEVTEALAPWASPGLIPPTAEEIPPPVAPPGSAPAAPAAPAPAVKPKHGRGSATIRIVNGSKELARELAALSQDSTPGTSSNHNGAAIRKTLPSPAPRPVSPAEGIARPLRGGAKATVSPAAEAPPRHTPPGPRRQPLRYLVLIPAVLVAGAVATGLAVWLSPRSKPSVPAELDPAVAQAEVPPPDIMSTLLDPRPFGKRVLVVTTDEQLAQELGPISHATLEEALGKARPHDVIRIVAGTAEDTRPSPLFRASVILDGARLPRHITIEGFHPSGRRLPVGWYPPAGSKGPLLTLSGVSWVRLRGFRFDGEGRAETLVSLRGLCPGLLLEESALARFGRAAVSLQEARGERESRVVLARLRVGDGAGGAVGILLDAARGATREVSVEGCAFAGPLAAGVEVRASATYVELTGNRFHRAGAALACRGGPAPLRLTLARNTLCDVGAAVDLSSLPPNEDETPSRIIVNNNLLCRTPALVRLGPSADPTALRALFNGAVGNVSDGTSAREGVTVAEVPALTFDPLPTDPAQPGSFLLYPKDSPLVRAGTDAQPAGAGPQR